MGCDIHAFLEYYDTSRNINEYEGSRCHAERLCMGRNYTFFNLIAGVRGFGGSMFPVRGFPTKPRASYEVEHNYFLTVLDVGSSPGSTYPNTRHILRHDADEMVSSGKSSYNENKKYLVDPNWHTPSYLHKNELIEIRRRYLIDMIDYESSHYKGQKRKDALDVLKNSSGVELMKHVFPSLEYVSLNTIIASMIAIENSGDYQSRFVFWFDS